MSDPTPEKIAEWKRLASAKGAIVPHYWETFPNRVAIDCGACKTRFVRNLVPNIQGPTFVCPNEGCRAKNWVPIYYDLKP